jgi:hypothetical protein
MESPFHVLEKNKNCAESGPGTVPDGTWIKYLCAGLKIGVPAGIVLKN